MSDTSTPIAVETGADPDKVLVKFLTAVIPDFWPKFRNHNAISISRDGDRTVFKIDVNTDHIEYRMDKLAKEMMMKRFAGDMRSLFWYSGTDITWSEAGIEIKGKPTAMLKAAEWSPNWDYTQLIDRIKDQVGRDRAVDAPTNDVTQANAVLEKFKAPPVAPKPNETQPKRERHINTADLKAAQDSIRSYIAGAYPELTEVNVSGALRNQRADIKISLKPDGFMDEAHVRLVKTEIYDLLKSKIGRVKIFCGENSVDISGNIHDIADGLKSIRAMDFDTYKRAAQTEEATARQTIEVWRQEAGYDHTTGRCNPVKQTFIRYVSKKISETCPELSAVNIEGKNDGRITTFDIALEPRDGTKPQEATDRALAVMRDIFPHATIHAEPGKLTISGFLERLTRQIKAYDPEGYAQAMPVSRSGRG